MTEVQDFFNRVAETSILKRREIGLVAVSPDREDFIIGVQYLRATDELEFLMGNFATILMPTSVFADSDEYGNQPDFARPSVENCGRTVKFGEYEMTSSDFLLKNVDL